MSSVNLDLEEMMNIKKTIAIIVNSLKSGGTERVAARLSVLWSSMGATIIFVTREPASSSDFEHICDQRIQIPQGPKSATSLEKAIIENSIDIVVYNGGWNSEHFKVELEAIKSTDAKLICSLHHSFVNWAFFLSNAGDFFKDDLLKNLDMVVCVNPVQALWWKNRGAAVTYIQNPRTFPVAEESLYNHESRSLIWIGRPSDPGKRLDEAVTIFICVKRKIKDAKLIIIGDVDVAYQKRILKRFPNFQSDHGIIFGGYCSDITQYLRQASAHILTSVIEVSSPMVVGEAASYGVPTVMYDLPVATEALEQNGIVTVPIEDRNAFANALIKVLDEKDYAERLSNSSKAWIRGVDEKEIVRKWKNLFSHLDDEISEKYNSTAQCDDFSEIETIDLYRRLTSEIYRSQKYFIICHFWKLKFFVRWINRIRYLRPTVAARLTSFLDTIR